MCNSHVYRLPLFSCLLVVNAVYAAPAPVISEQIGAVPPKAVIRPILKPGLDVKPRAQCPDPAIFDYIVRPNSRNSNGTYNFDIALIVKNVGAGKYASRSGQQLVSLSQEGRNLINQDFINLDPGQTLATFYYRVANWNATPGEFAVNLIASISYDPDILIDGNTHNDDCSNINNRKTITVADINRKLHIPGF